MCIYNTPMNTLGIGDPVPFGASPNSLGSGDRYDNIMVGKKNKRKPFMKQPAQPAFNGMQQLPLIVMANTKKSKK